MDENSRKIREILAEIKRLHEEFMTRERRYQNRKLIKLLKRLQNT